MGYSPIGVIKKGWVKGWVKNGLSKKGLSSFKRFRGITTTTKILREIFGKISYYLKWGRGEIKNPKSFNFKEGEGNNNNHGAGAPGRNFDAFSVGRVPGSPGWKVRRPTNRCCGKKIFNIFLGLWVMCFC